MEPHAEHGAEHTRKNSYRRLMIMTVLSFIAMYLLMYAMVDSSANVFANFNQFYMAALMTAPMVILELVLMKDMYYDKRRNAAVVLAAVMVLLVSWTFIRRQTAIGDRQFLRSMIPHHAGAILMCRRAAIQDSDIQQLCARIIAGQHAEIDQMKAMLQGTSAPGAAGDSAGVAAAVEHYHRALADGDTTAALSLLTNSAMVLESGDVETREEYRSHHLAADIEFARALPSVRGPAHVSTRGDVAWAISTNTTQGMYRGRPVASQGAELMVLTREADGWKIRAIHWSSHALRPIR